MKVSDAIAFCLRYHSINSKPNTLAHYEFLLKKFKKPYKDRLIESITTEEIISFLADMSEGRKQNTKRSRYTTLSAFFNLIANTLLPEMKNPCQSPAAKSLFRKPKTTQWVIFDKDTIDEAIFRTINTRETGSCLNSWQEEECGSAKYSASNQRTLMIKNCGCMTRKVEKNKK